MSDAVLSQFKQDKKEEKKAVDRKLRIGIIGTGSIAGGHTGAYLKQDDVELVAACDIVPGKAQTHLEYWFNHYGTHYYTDYKEMIEKEED